MQKVSNNEPFYYQLYLINNHYGVSLKNCCEYWIRKSAVEIVECIEPWMFDYLEFGIIRFQFDKQSHINLSHRFGLESEDMNDFSQTEWETFGNNVRNIAVEIDLEYGVESKNEIPDEIWSCIDCCILTLKTTCPLCEKETHNIDI